MQAITVQRLDRISLPLGGIGHSCLWLCSADGRSWKAWAMQELRLTRPHPLAGCLQEPSTSRFWRLAMFTSISQPLCFELSLLKSMAAGCAIVASDTPPVREVLCHDKKRFGRFSCPAASSLIGSCWTIQCGEQLAQAAIEGRLQAERAAGPGRTCCVRTPTKPPRTLARHKVLLYK